VKELCLLSTACELPRRLDIIEGARRGEYTLDEKFEEVNKLISEALEGEVHFSFLDPAFMDCVTEAYVTHLSSSIDYVGAGRHTAEGAKWKEVYDLYLKQVLAFVKDQYLPSAADSASNQEANDLVRQMTCKVEWILYGQLQHWNTSEEMLLPIICPPFMQDFEGVLKHSQEGIESVRSSVLFSLQN